MLTDYAHWGETYMRNGKLRIDNNRIIPSGAWIVEKNHVCKKIPDVLSACYEMWVDHDCVELRRASSPIFDAYIRDP
ncbi:hypothetical protein [Methylobacterium nodulans]|uniref:Uncharacterized protein n=1 Tax=Methylobacterium nodulans (strain LMG 21967 / CNCM I-2342 / ORS 2060) TaxID=460265 RepID=B8I9Y4_METNO|nr:hypothetical protein [Methylobacterium nodulans]ACL57212.1 hypothetical protein Mnod_2232 [Methylobacterium nodulans ORS 2060]